MYAVWCVYVCECARACVGVEHVCVFTCMLVCVYAMWHAESVCVCVYMNRQRVFDSVLMVPCWWRLQSNIWSDHNL